MGIRRTQHVRHSKSRGVNIRNAVVQLLEDNYTTDEWLKTIKINNINTTLSKNIEPGTLYISQGLAPAHLPRSLGQISTTYLSTYIVSLYYYHSPLDKIDIHEELVEVRDALTEFFIAYGSLKGLCNMGTEVHNARVKPILYGQHFWNGVMMDIILKVVMTRSRNR
jgi:hypothetical protein